MNVGVIGLGGSGKTEFVKSLCPNCTCHRHGDICWYSTERYGISMKLLDTPGLCELGSKPEEQIFQEMVGAVGVTNDAVDLIVFCVKTKGRLEKELWEALVAVRKHFTDDVWRKMIVVQTFSDEVGMDKIVQVEHCIRQKLVSLGASTVPILCVEHDAQCSDSSRNWIELFWCHCLKMGCDKSKLEDHPDESDACKLLPLPIVDVYFDITYVFTISYPFKVLVYKLSLSV